MNIAYPTDRPAFSRAYIGDKQFFEISKPCLGSIRVSVRKNSAGQIVGGHVTFVFAKNKAGSLLCLGGNQAQQLRLSAYSVSGQEAKYYLPLAYEKSYNSNKTSLEELTVYTDETTANKELFNITIAGGSSQS